MDVVSGLRPAIQGSKFRLQLGVTAVTVPLSAQGLQVRLQLGVSLLSVSLHGVTLSEEYIIHRQLDSELRLRLS